MAHAIILKAAMEALMDLMDNGSRVEQLIASGVLTGKEATDAQNDLDAMEACVQSLTATMQGQNDIIKDHLPT